MEGTKLKDESTFLEITPEALCIDVYTRWVGDPSAGAIATFIGVTRDNFQGKSVHHLEYEAYTSMALKKMHALSLHALKRWDLKKIAVSHRIGIVAVGEASVIIAASSAHRKGALEVNYMFAQPDQNF